MSNSLASLHFSSSAVSRLQNHINMTLPHDAVCSCVACSRQSSTHKYQLLKASTTCHGFRFKFRNQNQGQLVYDRDTMVRTGGVAGIRGYLRNLDVRCDCTSSVGNHLLEVGVDNGGSIDQLTTTHIIPHQSFDALDDNKDGQVTKKEYLHETHSNDKEHHSKVFSELDTNNDEVLTSDEMPNISKCDFSCNQGQGCSILDANQNQTKYCCKNSDWDGSGCITQNVCIDKQVTGVSGPACLQDYNFQDCSTAPSTNCSDIYDNVSGGEWFQLTPVPDTGDKDGWYSWFGKFTLQENNVTKYHAWMNTDNQEHLNFNKNKSIRFSGNTRLLLLDSAQCTGLGNDAPISLTPAILHLLGKKLQFDMTLKDVGSNLLGTLYLVSPPPSGNNRMNYCDTNPKDYDGKRSNNPGYCTEIDIFEGNCYGATSTLHVCKNGAKDSCAPDDNDSQSFDPSKNNMYPGQGCGHAAGCQSKSGGATGWFSVDNKKNDNIDPENTYTVIAEFPTQGGMKVTLQQDKVSKILHDSTGCHEGSQCGLPAFNETHDSWVASNMLPNTATVGDMATIMQKGMYLYSSLWSASAPDMSWVTNLDDQAGNIDIKKAAVTIENMSIEDL